MDVVGLFSVEGKVALVTGPEGCDGLAAALREGEPALHTCS